jgi:hypothetical protein
MRQYFVFDNIFSVSSFAPKLNNMEVAEFVAAALLVGIGSHIVFHTAPQYWHRSARERREQALRRLDNLTRDIAILKEPEPDAPALAICRIQPVFRPERTSARAGEARDP